MTKEKGQMKKEKRQNTKNKGKKDRIQRKMEK